MSDTERTCRVHSLGLVSYQEGLDLQHAALAEVTAGGEERIFLLEHRPVLTIGRGGAIQNLLVPAETLAAQGIELYEIERGGDITYHGPGQLVGYPILNLDRQGRDLHLLLRLYEEVGLGVLGHFGLEGRRDKRYTGVWVGDEKVMAIGVAVRKWVSFHGFALNIQPNLAHFSLIHPCGIKDKGVTSLARLLGRGVTRDEVEPVVIAEIARIFGMKMVWNSGEREGVMAERP